MVFCGRCGDLYQVEVGVAADGTAVPVCRCSSCNYVEPAETAPGDQKEKKTESDANVLLFKFGIEPMNPDGSKVGAYNEVERERAVGMRNRL